MCESFGFIQTLMKQIIVKPISASLTRDTELIGKMSPYCVCILGTQKYQTKHKSGAGKEPKWEDSLVFLNISGITVMHVQVWDKDLLKDDLVGEGQMDISYILKSQGMPFKETVNLTYKNKPSGKVFFTIEVQPIGGQGFNQGGGGQS